MSNNNIDTTAAQNETITNETATQWAYISEWMVPSQATDWISSLITEGSYKKGEIKKSSPRFANGKDKTDGYEVRVIAVAGIKPELEKAVVGYRKLIEKKVRHTLNEEQKELVAKFKKMLTFENIKEISETCVKLNDGSRIQLFTKKAN
jgi:hypothetical protein